MSEHCPACNAVMTPVPTNIIPSGWDLKKYRCEPCKITARVETTYSSDESQVTSCPQSEKS